MLQGIFLISDWWGEGSPGHCVFCCPWMGSVRVWTSHDEQACTPPWPLHQLLLLSWCLSSCPDLLLQQRLIWNHDPMYPCFLKLLWSGILLIAIVTLTRTTGFKITLETNLGVCMRESLGIRLIKVVNAVALFSAGVLDYMIHNPSSSNLWYFIPAHCRVRIWCCTDLNML